MAAMHQALDVQPAKARGAFLVFEGLDRSGKTTQAQLLAEKLGAHYLRFPDRSTEIGGIIDRYLKQAVELDDHAVHLLYSANRWEFRELIESKLRSGVHVVCDRYVYSGVAYSSAKGLDLRWCWQAEIGLPSPDAVLMLDLNPEQAGDRPGYGGERYENSRMQQKVREGYAQMESDFWIRVDANRTIEEVSADIGQIAGRIIEQVIGKDIARLEQLAGAGVDEQKS